MLKNDRNDRFAVIHPDPQHFGAIQELCKRVYPFTKPWSIGQLEAHHSYFPEGQLLVVENETQKIVGLAFSLIISWDDYSPQDNWLDFTSSGFFHNHNPKKGKTLYGAEVMVDPEYRGLGLGKMLYRAREEIARTYKLKRIRAGARLRGYAKHKDKFSPEEYVKRVFEGEIFDPTLSFQLGQGFVPLDVARNYLFNDPESLGYAAVIEWLNPDIAEDKDFKRQKESVDFFLTHHKLNVEHLPKELRRVVRKMTFLLGQVIKEIEGPAFFDKAEAYRKALKSLRVKKTKKDLDRLSLKIKKESSKDQLKLAHAFSILLEVINSCESAYRTWRQRQKSIYSQKATQVDLTFVLTAHPTEARAPLVIDFFRRITGLLIEGIQNNFVFDDEELASHLRALLSIPLVKTVAPSVLDEAEHIFSIVFHPPLFDFILSQREPYRIRLRTWVGGDKDGHPGVNDQVMISCLSRSREKIVGYISEKIKAASDDLNQLSFHVSVKSTQKDQLKKLNDQLKTLRNLRSGDGKYIELWKSSFIKFCNQSDPYTQKHHSIQLILRVFELFPAFVLPIELREDASRIEDALKDKNMAISKMVRRLADLSKGSLVTNYARGLVISHFERAHDLSHAHQLCVKNGVKSTLPLIPLFESKESLTRAEKLLGEWFENSNHLELVQKNWGGKLEVMLGYSDSAKQIGVLPSRQLIKKSMSQISKFARRWQLKPLFFHGSGGSVARGGGSLREQVSWWPLSAAKRPKLTIQGEMIQRTFATKEILHSQCLHFTRELRLKGSRRNFKKTPKAFSQFAKKIEEQYQAFIQNQDLLDACLKATPYRYLELLKIGSRPAKRPSGKASLESLRAIPWVLCWTQSRVLLPTWWGTGTAWENLSSEERQELTHHYESDPFFSSFVKQLGFTLSKVDLLIWQQYLKEFQPQEADKILKAFEEEYQKSIDFCVQLSGKTSLVWHRPWLEESIKLRSAYIHILNLLQIQAMRNNDEKLLKETLAGIACGMLTTG